MTYDALEFLPGLFQIHHGSANTMACKVNPCTVEELPPQWHFLWDERAAHKEYDAGLPRERAEAEAFQEILKLMNSHINGLTDFDEGQQNRP